MRKGLVAHGALLAVALLAAYQTWTRDKTIKPKLGDVTLMSMAVDSIDLITLQQDLKQVKVERRADATGSYLWATVIRTPPPPKVPEMPEDAVSSPDAPPAIQPSTREFPVGKDGSTWLEKVAPLRALRDLGTLDDARKTTYGLKDAKDKLAFKLKSGETRELLLGARVYGGNDRYVLDQASGKGYVLSGDVVRPIEGAETQLREKELHGFEDSAPQKLVVKTSAKERTLVRLKTAGEGGAPAWADAATPDKADQTFANMYERVSQLVPVEFSPDMKTDGMTSLAAFEYFDDKGTSLGRMELWKKPGSAPDKFDYFVKTERTRAMAKVNEAAAARVDQDLAQVVGG